MLVAAVSRFDSHARVASGEAIHTVNLRGIFQLRRPVEQGDSGATLK